MKTIFSIEAISEAKSLHSLNEDAFFIAGNMFGVFDGATGLDSFKSREGRTGGYLAASIAKDAFAKDGFTLSLRECAINANDRIADMMRKTGIDLNKKEFLWSTSAAVVKINDNTFEWLGIGDSPIIVIYTDNSFKVIYYYNHDHESLSLAKILINSPVDGLLSSEAPYLSPELLPTIIKTRQESNIKYGTINGESSMVNFLRMGTESLERIKHILTFTDGLIIPRKELNVQNFSRLVSIFLEGGLSKVLRYVRKLENSDQNCSKYIRLKQHDDATGIKISLM